MRQHFVNDGSGSFVSFCRRECRVNFPGCDSPPNQLLGDSIYNIY